MPKELPLLILGKVAMRTDDLNSWEDSETFQDLGLSYPLLSEWQRNLLASSLKVVVKWEEDLQPWTIADNSPRTAVYTIPFEVDRSYINLSRELQIWQYLSTFKISMCSRYLYTCISICGTLQKETVSVTLTELVSGYMNSLLRPYDNNIPSYVWDTQTC